MKTMDVASQMHRRLAQLRVTARLLEHELDLAKDGKAVELDRTLADAVLETLHLYIEDFDGVNGSAAPRSDGAATRTVEPAKPNVTRLN